MVNHLLAGMILQVGSNRSFGDFPSLPLRLREGSPAEIDFCESSSPWTRAENEHTKKQPKWAMGNLWENGGKEGEFEVGVEGSFGWTTR